MSRLDRHVRTVQTRLALSGFLALLSKGMITLAGACFIYIVVSRCTGWAFSQPLTVLLFSGIGLVIGTAAWAIWRRPGQQTAAVAIDEALKLKEKFSTALYARGNKDPFAVASVRDAERAAESVTVGRHFPIRLPQTAWYAGGLVVLALAAHFLTPQMDLFGHEAQQQVVVRQQQNEAKAREAVQRVLAEVNAVPKLMAESEAVKQARRELEAILAQDKIADPAKARRTALKASQELAEAMKRQIQASQSFAQARQDSRLLSSMKPEDAQGPVADAQRAMARGDYTSAAQAMQQAVQQFAQMDPAQQKQAMEQMKRLAEELNKAANDPEARQRIEDKLKQAGADPEQAKKMAEAMQKAAQGDQQAQRQLQQMQDQLAQNLPPQMQSQLQELMQQAQAEANACENASKMSDAAQQMAQGMQKANQSGQSQSAQQQMAQGESSMSDALSQMDAMAQDARQTAESSDRMAQASQGAGDMSYFPDGGDGSGGGGPINPGPSGWNQGGPGAGDRSYKSPAPFTGKSEMSPSQDNPAGRTLASYFVKADAIKGESRQQLREVTEAAEHEAAEEVEQERIGREAQRVVREYFNCIQKEEP